MGAEMTEVEQAVLKCLVEYYGQGTIKVSSLEKEDFYDIKAQLMFGIICQAAEKNSGKVDIILIEDVLRQSGAGESPDPDQVSVMDFIDLPEVPSNSLFCEYVEALKKTRRRRDLATYIREAEKKLSSGEDDSLVVEKLQQGMRSTYAGSQEYDFKEVLHETIERIQSDQMAGVEMPTGFRTFDDVWGGLMRKELHVIAGDSGHYKTTLTLNLMVKPLAAGKRVLWIDREMGKHRLVSHYCAITAGVEIWRLRKRAFREKDYVDYIDAAAKIENSQFIVLDDVRTIPKIAENILRYHPDIVVVDNLQNMDFPKSDNFWTFHMGIVNTKDLAMDYDIALVALSQVTRTPAEVRAGTPPTIENLFGSRAIKQNADVLTMVHWPWKDNPEKFQRDEYRVYHLKMRENGIAQDRMNIDPVIGRVYDRHKPHEEPVQEEPNF